MRKELCCSNAFCNFESNIENTEVKKPTVDLSPQKQYQLMGNKLH